MILTFRPIKVMPTNWKPAYTRRPDAPFYAGYTKTLNDLERELRHLQGYDPFLQLDASESDLRLDGQLRAGAKVGHPGCILTFQTKEHGPLTYMTDRYSHWHGNLRAIGLGLDALRRVERYGIGDRGEQYAGYKEIGSGIPLGQEPPASMTADEAARLMAELAGMPASSEDVIGDPDLADLMYKYAAKSCHPDVGGDPEMFKTLGEARRIVAKAHR